MRKRGTKEDEVSQVIRLGEWTEARKGRFEAKQDFQYSAQWNRKFYKIKQVNPVCMVEDEVIIVVTVFTFYF